MSDISNDVMKIIRHHEGNVKWHSPSSGSMHVTYPSNEHRDRCNKMLSQLPSKVKTLDSPSNAHVVYYKFSQPPASRKVRK